MPPSSFVAIRVMTIGELSQRTGMSIKALRRFEGIGLIYTAGRSAAGYRLFDESALRCVQTINSLRALGLTIAEIRRLAEVSRTQPERLVGRYLAERLQAVRARTDARIAELRALRQRIDAFEADHQTELTCRGDAGPGCADTLPATAAVRARRSLLDSPPGGRP